MIGWKIVCEIDGKEVVGEVASHPALWVGAPYGTPNSEGMSFYVYYNGDLNPVYFRHNEKIKVVEKNN